LNDLIVDTSDTYYIEDIYKDIDQMCDRYHDILSKEIIGKSVEGRDIIALRMSGLKKSKAAKVLLVGGIHAREDFSVMLCMKMIDVYCIYYNEGKCFDGFNVKETIDGADLYFVPVINPDGLNIVHKGLEFSSNYEQLSKMKIWGEDHTYWKANANGVDLNKNFDDGNWDIRTCVPGTHVPCSDRFKGFQANSEPETKALIDFCKHNNFTLMVSYHCSGNCTFWADSGTHHIFNGLDEKIMDELNKKYIYRKTKVSVDPKIYGCGFENWFRAKTKRPAFCVELSPFVEGGKQHDDNLFDELVWKHAGSTGLFFNEKAIEFSHEIHSDAKKYAALTE
jgi:g-D-glutamyl-meso-diaminopimelate peptidase